LPFSQKVIVINTYKITNLVYFPSRIHKNSQKSPQSMNRIKKKLLTPDGVELCYIVAPAKNFQKNKAILLLHGLGGSCTAWEEEQKLFHELDYTTYALDLRGHGLSGRPIHKNDYNIDKFVADIKALIDHEKIENVLLVGQCFGGMMAINFATMYPQIVQKLILIDTSYKPSLFIEKYVDQRVVAKILTTVAKISPNWHPNKYMKYTSFIGSGDFDKKRIFQDVVHTSPRSYLLTLNTVLSYDASSKLKDISSQTLVISGEADRVFPTSISTYIAQNIKKSKLAKIPNANHILVITNPKEVTESIIDFLEPKT